MQALQRPWVQILYPSFKSGRVTDQSLLNTAYFLAFLTNLSLLPQIAGPFSKFRQVLNWRKRK
jgi:hypothetical protein